MNNEPIIPGLPFYPANQVHRILGIPESAAHQMMANGILPVQKFDLDQRGNGLKVDTLVSAKYVLTSDIYSLVMKPPQVVEPTQMKPRQTAWNKAAPVQRKAPQTNGLSLSDFVKQ